MLTIVLKRLPQGVFHIIIRVDHRIVAERTVRNGRSYEVAEYICGLLKATPETQEVIK